jgi:hypothetical protein
MTADPRAALSALVAALQTHLETAAVRRGKDDPAVVAAYERIAEAFVDYEEALDDAYGEVTPLELFDEDLVGDDYDDDDDDDDDDDYDVEYEDAGEVEDEADTDVDEEFDDEDEDEDQTYQGLDDEEYDVDTGPRG